MNCFVRRMASLCLFLAIGCSHHHTEVFETPLESPRLRSGSGPTRVEIDFAGLICNVTLAPQDRRAVFVKATDHQPVLLAPAAYKTEFENAVGIGNVTPAPGNEIAVNIMNTTMRITEEGGAEPSGDFNTTMDYTTWVPGLGPEIPKLNSGVTGDFPSGNVSAWFSLNHGDATAHEHACRGKRKGQEREFAKWVTVVIYTKGAAELEIKTAINTKHVIKFAGTNRVHLRFMNHNPNDMGHPHFDMFGLLAEPPMSIENVQQVPGCIETKGTVPGCSSSAWP